MLLLFFDKLSVNLIWIFFMSLSPPFGIWGYQRRNSFQGRKRKFSVWALLNFKWEAFPVNKLLLFKYLFSARTLPCHKEFVIIVLIKIYEMENLRIWKNDQTMWMINFTFSSMLNYSFPFGHNALLKASKYQQIYHTKSIFIRSWNTHKRFS